jgi:hypothetical protein
MGVLRPSSFELVLGSFVSRRKSKSSAQRDSRPEAAIRCGPVAREVTWSVSNLRLGHVIYGDFA